MNMKGLNKQIEYGEPWKLNPDATSIAIPILRKYKVRGIRGYKLYNEVADQIILEDTGSISQLRITNNSPYAVFFKKGLILEGGNDTQSRVFINSVIVKSKNTSIAKIKCIHASKGIRKGAKFSFGGYVPVRVLTTLHGSQSDTWSSVTAYTANGDDTEYSNTGGREPRMRGIVSGGRSRGLSTGRSPIIGATLNYSIADRSLRTAAITSDFNSDTVEHLDDSVRAMSFDTQVYNGGTDDLVGYMKDSGDEIEQALANLPPNHEEQVGIAVVDEYGVRAFEIFNFPSAWEALSQTVVKNYSNILNNAKENGKKIDHETAYRLLDDFINYIEKKEGHRVHGIPESGTWSFHDSMVVGEFTKLYKNRMHVLINRLVNKAFPTSLVTKERYGQSVAQPENIKLEKQEKSPLDEQMEAAFKVNFLSKKRGYEVSSSLVGSGKTFTVVQKETGMSSKSVAEALKEGVELGLFRKNGNMYELTDEGRALDPQKFKRAFGR